MSYIIQRAHKMQNYIESLEISKVQSESEMNFEANNPENTLDFQKLQKTLNL